MDDGIWRRAYNLSDRHFSVLVVALALAGYIYIYATGLAETPIRSDGFEYYVYLPAVVIHHDPTLERFARDCCGGAFPGQPECGAGQRRDAGSIGIRWALRSSSCRSSLPVIC